MTGWLQTALGMPILNPKMVGGPGFEPGASRSRTGAMALSSRVVWVSARFLLYSNWIFFVSSCDLVYPPGSVNA